MIIFKVKLDLFNKKAFDVQNKQSILNLHWNPEHNFNFSCKLTLWRHKISIPEAGGTARCWPARSKSTSSSASCSRRSMTSQSPSFLTSYLMTSRCWTLAGRYTGSRAGCFVPGYFLAVAGSWAAWTFDRTGGRWRFFVSLSEALFACFCLGIFSFLLKSFK